MESLLKIVMYVIILLVVLLALLAFTGTQIGSVTLPG